MRHLIIAATLASAVGLAPAGAAAGNLLVSEPLNAGSGGVICSCVNLTDSVIVVDFALQHSAGGIGCSNRSLSPGVPSSCVSSSGLTFVCKVARDDGKSASAKRLACSLTSIDSAGNPRGRVSVDRKLRN